MSNHRSQGREGMAGISDTTGDNVQVDIIPIAYREMYTDNLFIYGKGIPWENLIRQKRG